MVTRPTSSPVTRLYHLTNSLSHQLLRKAASENTFRNNLQRRGNLESVQNVFKANEEVINKHTKTTADYSVLASWLLGIYLDQIFLVIKLNE